MSVSNLESEQTSGAAKRTRGHEGDGGQFQTMAHFLDPTVSSPYSLMAESQLKQHTLASVLQPLGLKEQAFATPPSVTSIRVIRKAGNTSSGGTRQGKDDQPLILSKLQRGLGPQGFTVTSMAAMGIADGYLIRRTHLTNKEAAEVPAAGDLTTTATTTTIYVDAATGEAVLRGSDVYSPGIQASSGYYGPSLDAEPEGNRTVQVVACINPAVMPLKNSYASRSSCCFNHDDVNDASQEGGGVSSCRKLELQKDTVLVSSKATVAMSRVDVVAGKKGVALNILDGYHPSQGAIMAALLHIDDDDQKEDSLQHGGLLSSRERECGGGELQAFLQNFSSMVPAAMLFPPTLGEEPIKSSSRGDGGIPPPASCRDGEVLRVLDMCAAPGGKSSQLLTTLKKEREASNCTLNFKLFCCERSASRAKKLKDLLVAHHGADLVATSVELLTCDSNKIYNELLLQKKKKKDAKTNVADSRHNKKAEIGEGHNPKKALRVAQKALRVAKYQKHRATEEKEGASCASTPPPPLTPLHSGDEVSKEENEEEEEIPHEYFDKVLLDPPCTGLGLRPKLIPHGCTLRAVQVSGDYQRKFLDSGLRVLKVGGLLSYSTCTISREENEGNVEWALQHYGSAIEIVQSRIEGASATTTTATTTLTAPQPLLDMAPYPSWLPIAGLDTTSGGSSHRTRYNLIRFGPNVGYTTRSAAGNSSGTTCSSTWDGNNSIPPVSSHHLDSVGFFAVCFRKLKSLDGIEGPGKLELAVED